MPHATPLPTSELKSDENPKVSSDFPLSSFTRQLIRYCQPFPPEDRIRCSRPRHHPLPRCRHRPGLQGRTRRNAHGRRSNRSRPLPRGHALQPAELALVQPGPLRPVSAVRLCRTGRRSHAGGDLFPSPDQLAHSFSRHRSAGHACLLQYINLMLVGHEGWTLDEVKRYHSRDFKTSKAAGHPEIEQAAGIEVTTGPLVRSESFSAPPVFRLLINVSLSALPGPRHCQLGRSRHRRQAACRAIQPPRLRHRRQQDLVLHRRWVYPRGSRSRRCGTSPSRASPRTLSGSRR